MSKEFFYCGAMSFAEPASGVAVFSYEDGHAEPVGVFGAEISSQSILTRAGDYLISVSERRGSGNVISYKMHDDGTLDLVDVMDTEDGPLSYVLASKDGRYVYVTCMGQGCLKMIRVEDDGKLTLKDDWRMTGRSITPRQTAGKTHSVMFSPDGSLLTCANLGTDEVLVFKPDQDAEKLKLVQAVPIDFGQLPRHMVFHPSGRYFYLVTEVGCRVYAFSVEGDKLTEMAAYSILDPAAPTGPKTMASDIRITADGRFICAAVRGQDIITSLRVMDNGLLDIVGHYDCGGSETRGLAFAPDGALLCANNSGTITRLDMDSETGELKTASEIADVPAAGSVMFL